MADGVNQIRAIERENVNVAYSALCQIQNLFSRDGASQNLPRRSDLDILKAKIDAGAARAITQYFFDNDVFFRFVDRLRSNGISLPVIPGILPLYNLRQIAVSAARTNVTIPRSVARRFEDSDDDDRPGCGE